MSLRLPDVRPSTSTAPLTATAAAAMGVPSGVPVCLGAADSVLGALGMGIGEEGDIAYVGGTSTIVLGVTDRVILDGTHRFLVTPMAVPDRWGLEMDLLATGGAFRWLAGVLGLADERTLLAVAAQSSAQDLPVFLPYVAPGEQGSLWDPDLTGVLNGLHVGHTAADIARALVDGIVIESRRCLLTLEDNGFSRGIPAGERGQRERSLVPPAAGRRVRSNRRDERRRRDRPVGGGRRVGRGPGDRPGRTGARGHRRAVRTRPPPMVPLGRCGGPARQRPDGASRCEDDTLSGHPGRSTNRGGKMLDGLRGLWFTPVMVSIEILDRVLPTIRTARAR